MSYQNSKKKLITGYSHHHLGIYPIELAFTLGAEIIEFHFTDSKK